MSRGAAHALRRETVEIWGFDFCRAVATEVPVAHIIGIDQHDVGLRRGSGFHGGGPGSGTGLLQKSSTRRHCDAGILTDTQVAVKKDLLTRPAHLRPVNGMKYSRRFQPVYHDI